MRLRKNLKQPFSIADETAYGETVSELIDAWAGVPAQYSKEQEATQEFQRAEAAGYASWDALTAYIDSYCARRVVEALKLKQR